jgi:hypothetical protein
MATAVPNAAKMRVATVLRRGWDMSGCRLIETQNHSLADLIAGDNLYRE